MRQERESLVPQARNAAVFFWVGIAAGAIAEHHLGNGALGSNVEWLRFLAGVALPATSLAVVYAVIPTPIANFAFLPRHLLPEPYTERPPGAMPVPGKNRNRGDTLADE